MIFNFVCDKCDNYRYDETLDFYYCNRHLDDKEMADVIMGDDAKCTYFAEKKDPNAPVQKGSRSDNNN